MGEFYFYTALHGSQGPHVVIEHLALAYATEELKS